MKRLLLVRHAKSSWNHPGLDDFDRPLNKRGKHDAPMMAERLARRGIRPDAIVVSPAKRAKRTAKLLAEGMGVSQDHVRDEAQIYEASVPMLLQVIAGFDDNWSFVMLVGHNPGLTSLVNALAGSVIDNLPTCGVADISLDIERWRDVAPGCGTCQFLDYPKKVQQGI
jgi:phosphohistidine phosphatase